MEHRKRRLHNAYTPDSDDAFYSDALETRQVTLTGSAGTITRPVVRVPFLSLRRSLNLPSHRASPIR